MIVHINYKNKPPGDARALVSVSSPLVMPPVAFPTSAKNLTTAQITLPLPHSPTLYLQYYCYCKDSVAFRESLTHSLSLASVPTKPFVVPSRAPGPHHNSHENHTLNLFWRFNQLVSQNAARFLPMYILCTSSKTRFTPPTKRIFKFLFLISEIDYLEYLLEHLL